MEVKKLEQFTADQISTAQLVVSSYNSSTGSCTRYKQAENVTAVTACVDYAKAHGKTINDVRRATAQYARDMGRDLSIMSLSGFCAWYRAYVKQAPAAPSPAPAQQETSPSPAKETTPAPAGDFGDALSIIVNAVASQVAQVKATDIQATLESNVREFIASEYGVITRKVDFEINGEKAEVTGVVHEQFETVLKFVMADEPVFLTGPAGSGKNVICKQVAEALKLDFYFSNAVTQEYKLTGFTDAMGTFHESQFYRAFKNGGVFMLDEMDASIPEVLVILNAAIANKYFDFPAPIGYVQAHENFRVIAAGNTFGLGADSAYVGRTQLDAASLDRFAIIKIDYCEAVEDACAGGDQELVSFCRAFRCATQNAGIQAIVSYRSITRMSKMLSVLDHKTVLQTCLVKSLEKSDLDTIKSELSGYGKFSTAFNQIVKEAA